MQLKNIAKCGHPIWHLLSKQAYEPYDETWVTPHVDKA